MHANHAIYDTTDSQVADFTLLAFRDGAKYRGNTSRARRIVINIRAGNRIMLPGSRGSRASTAAIRKCKMNEKDHFCAKFGKSITSNVYHTHHNSHPSGSGPDRSPQNPSLVLRSPPRTRERLENDLLQVRSPDIPR